jgi:hypothetical protein
MFAFQLEYTLLFSAEGVNESLLHHSRVGNGVPVHSAPWTHGGDCKYTCLYKEEMV